MKKKLRKALDDMYKDLLGQDGGDIDETDTNAMSLLGNEDFYAYVFFEIFIEQNPNAKKEKQQTVKTKNNNEDREKDDSES